MTAPAPAILVVEDDPTIRRLLALLLTREGHRVAEAADAPAATAWLEANEPSLVLLDVNLPGGTGFDVLQKLRRSWPAERVAVLILSALQQEVNVLRGLELGAQDYITKPFSPREVVARVESHLVRRPA